MRSLKGSKIKFYFEYWKIYIPWDSVRYYSVNDTEALVFGYYSVFNHFVRPLNLLMLVSTFELFFQNLTQCELPQSVPQQATTPSTSSISNPIFLFFTKHSRLLNIISIEKCVTTDKKLKNTLKDCKKTQYIGKAWKRCKSLKKYSVIVRSKVWKFLNSINHNTILLP